MTQTRKFTPKEVLEIRRNPLGLSGYQLAIRYGADKSSISSILRVKSYKWVVDENSTPPTKETKDMSRDAFLKMVRDGHEWEGASPDAVNRAVKSLKVSGMNIKKFIRYEICDDDFD